MPKLYKIQRWDGIIDFKVKPKPGLYIIPDDDLIQLCLTNPKIGIKITETNSGYDNKLAWASVRPSEFTGGFRPNFQDYTGLMVILPELQWEGYPPDLGYVNVLELSLRDEGGIDESYVGPGPGPKYNSVHIYCYCFILLLLIIILIGL
jgi:hypothetical protein